MSDFKYWVADKLFAKELDDAYALGIREGASFAVHQISFSLDKDEPEQTKTQAIGYQNAVLNAKKAMSKVFVSVGKITA